LVVLTIPLSLILGTFIGVARVYGNKYVRFLATGYVEILRGIPMLVTILVVYFILSESDFYISAIYMGIIALVMSHAAYLSDYIRGAVNAIDVGQSLAAQTLGMTRFQEIIHVILPQAVRAALPGILNEIIYIIQGSSLVYIIGVSEMFSVAKTFTSMYFQPFEIYLTLAFVYLVVIGLTSIGFRRLEKRLAIPGIETTY
jgi:polar amino acid transport system permease protein